MTVRLPQILSNHLQPRDGVDILQAEILADMASSLGGAGRRVEAALGKLREATPATRPALLRDAAEAVWAFQVQRELCGLRDWNNVARHFDIPREVLVRLGCR